MWNPSAEIIYEMMKKRSWIYLIAFCLAIPSMAQEGLYYYGANFKILPAEDDAIMYKDVIKRSKKKYLINTYVKGKEGWVKTMNEKIKVKDNLNQRILYNTDMLFQRKILREMNQLDHGIYHFQDTKKGTLIRQGTSLSFLPLHLDGSVTEYHSNGVLKSKAVYRNNQLISNENWLIDGSKYIDSIFYSADASPVFLMGENVLKTYILKKLKESELDLSEINDEVILGWVVMENGKIDGALALQGKSNELNKFLENAIMDLPGEWTPAILNDTPVRYFITFPVNILHNEPYFRHLEYSSGVLYYNKY